MKKYVVYPLLAILGGAAAFFLRLQQRRTGFEVDTGLPIPGNSYALALPILLAALAVVTLLLVLRLPRDPAKRSSDFADAFFSTGALGPTLLVAGLLIWLISGACDLYTGLPTRSWLTVLQGALAIFAALSLFPAVSACRRGGKRIAGGTVREQGKRLNGNLLLVPVVCLVVRLVLAYREDSVNPALSAYYIELLALALLILSFYRAASFAFANGKTRRFVFFDLLAIILSVATVADKYQAAANAMQYAIAGGNLPTAALYQFASAAMYCGCALVALGLLLLRLEALAQPARRVTAPLSADIADGDGGNGGGGNAEPLNDVAQPPENASSAE